MDTTQDKDTVNQAKSTLPDMRKKSNQDLLARAKERTTSMMASDHDNRIEAMEDLKFVNVPGAQWDENMKLERGTRPCYEFNKLRISCKRVINDMRANRPGAKVRAVENGDPDIATINEGLIRNIWNISTADSVIDYEAEYQVSAGMGAWRVDTQFLRDDAFNQEITIKPFRNPFTVYVDNACRDFQKRDARDWSITEKIPEEVYQKRWPKAETAEFSAGTEQFDDEDEWDDEETIRICEYWYKEDDTKEIWKLAVPIDMPEGAQLEEGEEVPTRTMIVDSTTDEATGIDPAQIVERRTIASYKIKWVICSGDRILEVGEWAGREFPFIIVYGEHAWIDGRNYWWGLPRFAKDAQRSYNVARTAISETIAQAPKTYFWATPKQAEGHLNEWQQAHKKNYPYMLYNTDPQASGPPDRMGGADVPVALIQESQMASDEIKAVTGIHDASMGVAGNETSGRAIMARQNQGEIATFNFGDNMSKGIQRTYEIILDLIPEIYDTERELRILGGDGAESYKKVNEVVMSDEMKMVKINDLAEGKYDVTVTEGPSFSTLREEAAATYSQMAQQFPELMQVAGDLVMKSMDLPYADEIADRLKTLLPPGIQDSINADAEIPPEVTAMMAKIEEASAMVEEKGMEVMELEKAAKAEAEAATTERHKTEQARKDVEIGIERLRRVKAEFDAFVSKQMAGLDEREAGMQTPEQPGVDPAVVAIAQAVKSVDDTLAEFMTGSGQMLQSLQKKADRKVVSSKPVREGGKLYTEVTFDDGEVDRVEVQDADG